MKNLLLFFTAIGCLLLVCAVLPFSDFAEYSTTLGKTGGIVLLIVMIILAATPPTPKQKEQEASNAAIKHPDSLDFIDQSHFIKGKIANKNYELKIASPLSYRVLKDAVSSYFHCNFFAAIVLSHLSVEHSIIASLRQIYKNASPYSVDIPKLYKDKIEMFIKLNPSCEAIEENALILWNMSRITYVHPLSSITSKEYKKDYKQNELNLITGIEAISIEALQRALDIHSSLK